MSYQNPLPPEGINVSRENHLAAVIWLVVGFFAFVAASVAILYLAGGAIASHLPRHWEDSLATRYLVVEKAQRPFREKLLQTLADELAAKAGLPKDITFRLRYVDDGEANAFASLGGVITIHRGLLDTLQSENALAFVLAHEMSHVINRDVAASMGGQLLVSSVVGFIAGAGSADWLDEVTGATRTLTLLTFSRDVERRADDQAIEIMGKAYGHLGGVQAVMHELVALEAGMGANWVPEILKTHPDAQNRLAALPLEADKLGLSLSGALTPLPLGLRKRSE